MCGDVCPGSYRAGSPPPCSPVHPPPPGPGHRCSFCVSRVDKSRHHGLWPPQSVRPWLRPCVGAGGPRAPPRPPHSLRAALPPALQALTQPAGRPTPPQSPAPVRKWGMGPAPISEHPGPAHGFSFPEVSTLHGHELGYALSTPGLGW